jgi:hypothetical protein
VVRRCASWQGWRRRQTIACADLPVEVELTHPDARRLGLDARDRNWRPKLRHHDRVGVRRSCLAIGRRQRRGHHTAATRRRGNGLLRWLRWRKSHVRSSRSSRTRAQFARRRQNYRLRDANLSAAMSTSQKSTLLRHTTSDLRFSGLDDRLSLRGPARYQLVRKEHHHGDSQTVLE